MASHLDSIGADGLGDGEIQRILAGLRCVALVGASPRPERPSHAVMAWFLGRGVRVVPVNPALAGARILGQPVVATLAEAVADADMLDIFRNPEAAGETVAELLAAPLPPRLKTVWMQLGVVNSAAAARARAAGLSVVMDRCPKIEHARLSPAFPDRVKPDSCGKGPKRLHSGL